MKGALKREFDKQKEALQSKFPSMNITGEMLVLLEINAMRALSMKELFSGFFWGEVTSKRKKTTTLKQFIKRIR